MLHHQNERSPIQKMLLELAAHNTAPENIAARLVLEIDGIEKSIAERQEAIEGSLDGNLNARRETVEREVSQRE